MSLQFVYGRAGCGKTRYCLNEIKSRLEDGVEHPLVLLVPEQFSFQAEKELISVLESRGVLKTEVLSFQRLAFRIFNEVGGIAYPHIHSAGKSMMLYRIMDQLRGNFKVFSRSLDSEGFVNKISSLITEFKRYSVAPERLAKVGGKLSEDNPLKEKLKELNQIYEAFEKELADRYRDSDDDLTLASQKLEKSAFYEGAEIWIDGFSSFTPQEYGMIGGLMKKSSRMVIALCTDSLEGEEALSGLDVFSQVKHASRKLTKIANENKIKVEEPINLNNSFPFRFKDSKELSHLERHYTAYPCQPYKTPTKDISLFSAMNAYSEIEAAARDIIRLCRDHGMRYRDILVATRNLPDYEKLIEAIFSEYGIPCFMDRKVEIIDYPVVRLILSMLDIFGENWSYEAVFRYLKTGLTGISQQDIDVLENYVLACGIRGGRWTDDEDWCMSPDLIPNENSLDAQNGVLKKINEIRRRVTAPLLAFRSKTRGRRTASVLCGCLYDHLLSLGVPDAIEKSIERFRAQGDLALASEYSQVWNILMEVFDQIVEVMGEESFSLERFGRILKIGLGEYKIGLIPASLDQVLVGSVERTKNCQVKALYLLGVNDGVFPSAAVKEGVLSDQERLLLCQYGVELASDTRSQAFDEQYLVYRALATASRYLRISWPISDHEGKTKRPSMIISRLRKVFPAISERSDLLPASAPAGEMELIVSKKPAFRQMVSALRRKADGKSIAPLWEDVWRWFAFKEGWRESCEKARAAFQYKNLAQKISRNKVVELYGDPLASSVSRLEKYTACPFAFYVQYGLCAKERKIYRLSPPDIGTFMHAAIERFSRIVARGDMTWRSFDREWCKVKVSGIVDEMLQKMNGSGIAASKRYTALAKRLKRVVARAVWLIAEHIRRSSFNPVEYEVGFGENEKYPPITIELESGQKIRLSGRVDRVDALKTGEGTYLRIVDYKSGGKDFRLSDVYYGLQLQLITYLDALWESSLKESEAPVLPGGMFYFKIDDPILKGKSGLAEEEVEAAIMRQLKMKGLLLADVKLVREMDNTIDGASMIIPATVNKGDVLGRNTSGATLEQFRLLRKYARKLLSDLGNEIMKGNVDISPYKKKGTTSCQHCGFLSVCQFDASTKDNSYRLLFDKDNDEVWALMKEADEP